MMSKITAWLPLALLLAFPLEASEQADPEVREFGSVWIWSDPATLQEAVAVLIGKVEADQVDQQPAVTETKVYLESPRSNRAEVTYSYSPETAGFRLIFRDSISGWRAEVESGIIFDDESILPISQAKWMELIPLLNDPEIEGVSYVKVSLSNGIEISAEHATGASLPPDQDDVALLHESLTTWMSELSPDDLRRDWDFPESTLEMLEFLEIPQAEPLREGIALIDALISTSLSAYSELESRRTALLDEPPRAKEPLPGPRYERRDWKVARGSLDSEEADKAGARTTIDLIRKELASYD